MAKFVGAKKVVVEGVEYTADHVMIAVGGTPSMPDVPGAELCINRHVMHTRPLIYDFLFFCINRRVAHSITYVYIFSASTSLWCQHVFFLSYLNQHAMW